MFPVRFCLAFALLTIGAGSAWGQSPAQKATTDSLRRVLAAAPRADTSRVRTLHRLVAQVGRYDMPQAVPLAQRELAEASRARWPLGQTQAEEDLGNLYWRQSAYGPAEQHALAAFAGWQRLGQPRRAMRMGLLIVGVLAVAKQYDQAAAWQARLLGQARAARDTVSTAQLYMEQARLAMKRHRLAQARDLNQLALRTALTKRRCYPAAERQQLLLLETVIDNNLADVYIQLGQPRLALPYARRAVGLARQRPFTRLNLPGYETTLADAYRQLGQPNQALRHALEAHRLGADSKLVRFKVAVNDLLDSLYQQQGNYRLARRYVAESRALETQWREQEQATKVAELQARYDTREKERAIEGLTQQNRIAQLGTLQQRTVRNAALLSAGLLLLAVGVLYNRYRLRQHTVRLLDRQNQEKAALLAEKTLLLQEVHHRVKNNLQIVVSLFYSQLDTLRDPAATAALRESLGRVQTMALIHESLYQLDGGLARLDMRRFLAELLAAVAQSYQREAVALTLDVAPINLSPQTAVPLGLIVNELATNAFKYAFQGHGPHELRVALRRAADPATGYELTVADNGPGLPPFDPATVQSLGLRLTAGLVRQLGGRLRIEREAGARFVVLFAEAGAAALAAVPVPAAVPALAN